MEQGLRCGQDGGSLAFGGLFHGKLYRGCWLHGSPDRFCTLVVDELAQRSLGYQFQLDGRLFFAQQNGLGHGQDVSISGGCSGGQFSRLESFRLGLTGALDINAPADQLGSQAGVLSAFADGQRQLVIRNHNCGGLAVRVGVSQCHVADLGRAQRVANKRAGVPAPCHDVDLFSTQLVDDGLDAHTTDAHARSDGIDAFLQGSDGNLGTRPCLAGDALDLYGPTKDLGHFQFEKAAKHLPVRARDDDLRTSAGAPHLHHIRPYALANAVPLARDLLAPGHRGFGPSQTQGDRLRRDVGDHAIDQFALTVRVAAEQRVTLRLTDSLQDDLLGRLCCDAAKRLGRYLCAHK